MNRLVRIVLASLISVLILGLLLLDFARLFPRKLPAVAGEAGMLALHAAGRSGFCDATASRGAWDHLMRRGYAIEQEQASVRKLREDGNVTLWQTKSGQFWAPTRDKLGFVPLLAEQELRVYGKIRPGNIVLDAGANIGDFTRSALNDGAALVVAIEIASDTLESLRRNFAAEIASGRVIVYSKGVWDSDSELTLRKSSVLASGVDTVVEDGAGYVESEKVKLTTIDKIVDELKLPRVDLIKLDVEGAEVRGVLGARGVIRRFKPALAFDSEGFSESDVATLQRELSLIDGRYRMRPGPCIFIYGQKLIRADVIRFEIQP